MDALSTLTAESRYKAEKHLTTHIKVVIALARKWMNVLWAVLRDGTLPSVR
jgi:hypothetical protein